jgi:tetratricopeptide (TPR) repeat protein
VTTVNLPDVLDRAAELLARDRAEEAAALLAPALGRHPEHVGSWVLMARIRLVLADAAGALDAAGTASALAPSDASALAVASMALTELGRHPEALSIAHRAVGCEPDNPYWHDRVAWALLAAETRLDEAERAARTAVELGPEVAHFHLTHGVALTEMGRRGPARQALLTALRLEPDNAVAQHLLAALDVDGRNVFAAGQLARAAEIFAGALRTDPRQHESRLMLDVALRTFLIRTAYLLFVVAAIAAKLRKVEDLGPTRICAAVGVLALVLYGLRFVGALSDTLRRHLWTVVTTGRQGAAATGAAVCAVLLLTVALGPASWALPLLAAAVFGALFVRIATTAETNDHVRAAGIAVPYVLGTATLWVIVVGTALMALLGLAAGLADGGPALLAVAVGFGAATLYTGSVLVRRRRAGSGPAQQPG